MRTLLPRVTPEKLLLSSKQQQGSSSVSIASSHVRRRVSWGSIGGLLLSLVFLSGCTLTPPKVGSAKNGDTNQENPDGGRNPFQVGAQPGAIWRSTDGGKTFEPKVTVDEKRRITTADVLDISFLTRDPKGDPTPKRAPSIFVGTAENGIFKSDDSGEVWEPREFPPQKVYRFMADSVNPERLFATGVVGGYGKVFRTKDGGATWQDVYTEPGGGTVMLSLAQSRQNPEMIFAASSTGVVVRSMDGGETWRNIGGSLKGPITEIVFDAKVPNRLYALAFEKEIFRSDDNGLTWINPLKTDATASSDPNALPQVAPMGMVSLFADPYLSNTLYLGIKAGGVLRSRNGGETWEKLNIIESAEQFAIRAIAINPKNSQEIVFVSGRNFYKSTNGGETWSVVPLSVDREVSVLVYDPFDPSVLYMGLRKFKK